MPFETPAWARRPFDVLFSGVDQLPSRVDMLVVMPVAVLAMGGHLTGEASNLDQRSWAYGAIVRATESAYLCQM
jgi:hypothetical protein